MRRSGRRVELLALAWSTLFEFARTHERLLGELDAEEWSDLALRVMLEYDRGL